MEKLTAAKSTQGWLKRYSKIPLVILIVLSVFLSGCRLSPGFPPYVFGEYNQELVDYVEYADRTEFFLKGDWQFNVLNQTTSAVKLMSYSHDDIQYHIKPYSRALFHNGALKKVMFVNDIYTGEGGAIAGAYYPQEGLIIISISSTNVFDTLAHEVGHAVWNCISVEDQNKFIDVYLDKLEEIGFCHELHSEYRRVDSSVWGGIYPTRYSMHSVGEFFAEIFMLYCNSRRHLKDKFPYLYQITKLSLEKIENK